MSLAEILAVWGAVWSTVAIIWNIRRDVKSHGRLKLTVGPVLAREMPDSELFVSELLLRVVNTGKAPVSLKRVGYRTRSKELVCLAQPQERLRPVILNESEEYVIRFKAAQISRPHALRVFYVKTTDDRFFFSSFREWRRLLKRHTWMPSALQDHEWLGSPN